MLGHGTAVAHPYLEEAVAHETLLSQLLKEEWLEPLGLSSYKLAKDLGISATALGKILSGKHRMSMDTCWRLARYFGVSRNYFFNIQADIEERNNSDSFDSETKGLPVYNWG